MGGFKEDYLAPKKYAKRARYNAKKVAQETRFSEINTEKDCNKIFKFAKKSVTLMLLATNVSKLKIKISYLGIKKNWISSLSIESSVECPAIKITKDMMTEAVMKTKEGKACGPSGIVIEMVKTGGDVMLDVITDMINLIIK